MKNILAKMVVTCKDWAEKLPVLPIEMKIQSLRVLVETKVLEEDWPKARFEQLALIDEKRSKAQYHAQGYQKRIARTFNKKVKPRNLKEGGLVLKVLRDEAFDLREKMKPRWSGPFIIKKIMSRDATRIIDLDRKEMLCPISMDRHRKYHI